MRKVIALLVVLVSLGASIVATPVALSHQPASTATLFDRAKTRALDRYRAYANTTPPQCPGVWHGSWGSIYATEDLGATTHGHTWAFHGRYNNGTYLYLKVWSGHNGAGNAQTNIDYTDCSV